MTTILIVDDEMGIRELLSEILRDEGHSILLADCAEAARSYRKESRPDLVLLDIWMPDTDGLTLLKEWRTHGLLTMPVIMMSGHGTIDTAVEATRVGAVGFLEKPIGMRKLMETVSHALKHAPLLDHPIQPPPAEPAHLAKPAPPTAPVMAQTLVDLMALPHRAARESFERMYFDYHLQQEAAHMARVAEKTGLERTHLYRKLKDLGLRSA